MDVAKPIRLCIDALIPQEHQWKLTIMQHWNTILGAIKFNVSIEQIAHNRIVLGVKHPAWAQELMAFAPLIKQRINALFDDERIQKIHFRITVPTQIKSKHRNMFAENLRTDFNPVLSDKELRSIDAMKDKELAASCKQFLIRCKKVKGSS